MTIEIQDVTKRFDGFTALDRVSLAVRPGELVALLGPSGSGKTTLLRIIAGLEFPSEGAVLFDNEDASDRHVGERRVGFVFQHYALFRHMSVLENVAFGLRVKSRRERPAEAAIQARVMELLELVQLAPFARRFPSQLSGGQRQRVALARALAIEPRVLLLDEPFGALDAKVRKELRRWLRALHDRMGLTSVFVTHDQEEALEMADRVVVMSQGRIEQIGAPEVVYDRPGSPFVHSFLGETVVLSGVVRDGLVEIAGLPVGPAQGHDDGALVQIFVRPHDLVLEPAPIGAAAHARVESVRSTGPLVRVDTTLAGSGERLQVELPRGVLPEATLRPDDPIVFRPRRFTAFRSAPAVA